MKLFLIGTEFHRTRGGIQYVNRLLVRAFRKMAESMPLELTVLSYGDRPEDFAQDSAAAPGNVRAFARHGVRMGLALSRALLRWPDVVLLTHISLLPFARLIHSIAPRAQTCILTHGIEAWEPLAPATRRALQQARSVVAPSEYTAMKLREQNGVQPERLAVLPHGLEPEWTSGDRHRRSDAAPTLLSVARLNAADRLKGVDAVLSAMPHILERVPEARYRIVGDGDDRPRLERLAATLGINSRVEFRGDLAGEDLRRAYADAGVFVLPSKKEGFGIVFAEAMWFELPVVAARAGANPEVVQDGITGILVPPDAPSQLASAVSGLLLLDAERQQMGKAGRRRVEENYLFSHFAARWHSWLSGIAPQALRVGQRSRLRPDAGIKVPRPSD